MTTHEIRQKYLDFFVFRGHKLVPSASLLPENDPTTLFTGSGMQPMVPYLLGETHPKGTRIVDAQKCFRSQDIDEVGDNRHTTFFEMLGNWSLGDYFKKEQVAWMFEFLTHELRLDPYRLYVTVFRGNAQVPRDEETVGYWKDAFASVGVSAKDVDFSKRDGMQGGRIFYYDEKKNWWSRSGSPEKMPVGEPGGPDSEMFWDFGIERGLHEKSAFAKDVCHVNCDCGRFAEIGNNVFMQYKKTATGFELLPKANVDFGGGLERLASAVLDDPDMFLIDVFHLAREVIEQKSNTTYSSLGHASLGIAQRASRPTGEAHRSYAFRVILDHLRAATFLVADGVFPSNKDQGYYVRRLIRRAVRFANTIGVQGAFCGAVAQAYVREYTAAYPELAEKEKTIIEELTKEETKFKASLGKGLKEFEKLFTRSSAVSGVDAFNLYQSYGFPWELTEELAREHGQKIDRAVFQSEFSKHQDLSRSGSGQKFAGGLADHSDKVVRLHTATHLLHQALRSVLGSHVQQKGSNITPERLRFDFSHPQKMTDDEKQRVEAIVNEQIKKDLPVHFEILDLDEAKRRGAIGLFEDKYAQLGGKIKVYFIGGDVSVESFSREVCGGPHVEKTGELGRFKIQKEEAVASGVRRIKAVLD
ncbi:alanine--tRNA ligase [Candidatus Uhrbacteria bacterium]|nr:alanine--tRNA ligase [Candidatus Uhrbacteria bacterium]